MDNIHAPTVPSGPTTVSAPNGDLAHLTFADLQRKKDDMEAELKALGAVLDSHGADMNTPLTTGDGFPRADIDVAQVRTTRARIIHLRNDYRGLMTIIEKHLHEHFASLQENEVDSSNPASRADDRMPSLPESTPTQPLERAFARVNSVVPGSPAEVAGLKPGDEIRKFGYVNHSNHDSLRKVAECVQGNEGQPVQLGRKRHVGLSHSTPLKHLKDRLMKMEAIRASVVIPIAEAEL
ncbi:26S proteasome non-ATPase regulatory subunit 9 [Colletotrichum orbiculare MAFF 240422]|uniref:Probable 26S proteasome regulatory subunit p27 n=1 Tax=Colletotrichum orbiculare (strain 104-T / ATCC 96160 / CBS 514.97 / LARS 414 / MAFF 240422) TaxID=1213857 RepID=A0A484G1A0_COLOR|nr:26S proteasome non-ATPase regulatory subunit 9 [Colletotrichum orbiculare MAFF 240422]